MADSPAEEGFHQLCLFLLLADGMSQAGNHLWTVTTQLLWHQDSSGWLTERMPILLGFLVSLATGCLAAQLFIFSCKNAIENNYRYRLYSSISSSFFLVWNIVSLCSLGWTQTCDPPPSECWALGLQAYAGMLGTDCCYRDHVSHVNVLSIDERWGKEKKSSLCIHLATLQLSLHVWGLTYLLTFTSWR